MQFSKDPNYNFCPIQPVVEVNVVLKKGRQKERDIQINKEKGEERKGRARYKKEKG